MSTFSFQNFLIVVFGSLSYCHAMPTANVPSLPSCKIKDEHVNECLKTYLQEAIKHSAQGSSQYSIPPLDPYFVPKVVISSTKNMGVNVEMKNSSTYGFSSATLTKVKADPVGGLFEVHYFIPVSTLLSHYNLTGKIFSIPINGRGKSNITLYDVIHEVKVQGNVVDDNNDDSNKYFSVSSVTMHLRPKKIKFKFDELFKDNKELGNVVNQMMNDNWRDIFARLQPRMEEDTSKHMFQLLNNFFRTVPYDKIFAGA